MEEQKETKDTELLKLDEMNIIMKIPENTVRAVLIADIIDKDGNVEKVHKVLMPDDIWQSRNDFLENVDGGDDYDARYVITEKGLRWLEQLEKERNDEVHSVCD